jgi:25S rRNA (adenine2142-N1)-methyltransferase
MSKKRRSRSKGTAPKPLVPSAMKSLKRARRVTSEFHRIQREMEVVKVSNESNSPQKQQLERQLRELGGRQAYQEASVLTTGRHRTCKWIFAIITKLGLRPTKSQSSLALLEVGAVNTQLLSVPWLAVRAIDIKAQHPRIEQKDFFDLKPKCCYDAVVLSMVLNCVSSPLKRGRMLSLVREHLLPGGHLFLMIPRRCIENSPYCSFNVISEALSIVGLKVVETKLSPKVAFFCAQRVCASHADSDGDKAAKVKLMKRFADPPRPLVRNAEGMNDDFAVCFEPTGRRSSQ